MCDQFSGRGRAPPAKRGPLKVPGDLELSDSDPEDPGAGPPLDAEVRELNSSSSEDEDGGAARPAPPPALANFSLKGGSSSFSFRSRNIFDCLDGVAKETCAPPGQDNVIDGVFVRPPPPPPLAGGVGPQAGRKRHATAGGPGDAAPAPAPARSGAPDYLLHPERWTRYSLEEVAETSDSRNRSVALQYLLSLQQGKEPGVPGPGGGALATPDPSGGDPAEGGQACMGPAPHRILFSRPDRAPGREPRAEEGRGDADGGGRRGGLSHLQEEEEEEEEEEEVGGHQGGDLDCSPAPKLQKAQQRKRKWGHGRGGGAGGRGMEEEEKEEVEEKKSEPEVPPAFSSFRKANRKNYRKISEPDDD